MAGAEIEAVVAGTRGFALALRAPLEERLGTRPEIATDPAHALIFTRGPASVVVVEFLGEDSLSAIKDLVLDGEGVRIVAAVPAVHAAAEEPLRALGVDPVRWDGTPGPIVGAVERQAAAAPPPAPRTPAALPRAAPPAGPSRAAPAPRPARPGPALTPTTPIGAVAARRGSPALTPTKPVPAVARPPVRAAPAKPPGAAAPGPSAPPRPPAPPAPTGAQPVARGGPASAPPPPARAAAPPPPQVVAPPPPPPQEATPEDDLAAPPLADDAHERLFEGYDEDIAAAAEALGAPPAEPPAAPGPASGPAPGLFDDLIADGDPAFDVDVDEGGPRLAAPPASAGAPWPTAVPDAVEAADALGRALLGDPPLPGTALAAAADVVLGLSELERAVFAGAPQPVDTEPVRRAAVMRVRVAFALATAPGPGGAVDTGAVSAFLAEIDALLSDVNALAAGAPADVHASLEAIRNALVKEAIDFSEAVQLAAPAETLVPEAPPVRPRAAPARVLSMEAAAKQEPRSARQRGLFVILALSALAAAAFHGYGLYAAKSRLRAAPTMPGAPAGAIASPGDSPDGRGAPVVLHGAGGAALDPAEVKAFAAEQQRKGNAVQEIAPGVIVVVPGRAQPPPVPR